VQACLVLKLGGLEEEGSGEASGATGVGSSGVLMGFGMRFHNSGKVGKDWWDVQRRAQCTWGWYAWGGRGKRFLLLSCVMLGCGVSPMVCSWFLVVVLIPPTV
jgi:hypothetical protein